MQLLITEGRKCPENEVNRTQYAERGGGAHTDNLLRIENVKAFPKKNRFLVFGHFGFGFDFEHLDVVNFLSSFFFG